MDGRNISLKQIFGGVATAVAVGVGLSCFTMLDETERGIDYQFGKMLTQNAGDLRPQGFSWKLPWTSVTEVEIGLQQKDYEGVETYTKDNQVITAKLAVMFKIPQEKIVQIYKNNPDWENKLEKTIYDSVKAALGRQEAQNVAQNRDAIMKQVTQEAAVQVGGLLGLEIVAVQLPNFDFNEEFEHAVASAANAKAELNKKQTELEQSVIDAKKEIVTAEGKATAAKKTADGQAYGDRVKLEEQAKGNLAAALAQAEGFEKIKASIGEANIGTYLLTKQWNGAVPMVAGGNGTIIDLRQYAPAVSGPKPQ